MNIWKTINDWFARAVTPPVAEPPAQVSPSFAVDADGILQPHGGALLKVVLSHPTRTHLFKVPKPTAIVWHYTATDSGASGMATRRLPPRNRKNPDDPSTSWHFTVDRDGTVWQLAATKVATWHCRDGMVGGVKTNDATIGIELVGKGKSFTRQQVEAAQRLIVALGIKVHVGHERLNKTGKQDPGPVWEAIMKRLPETSGHTILMR